MNQSAAILLSLGFACSVLQLVSCDYGSYGSASSNATATTTASSALTGEALYKSLVQALARDENALHQISVDNAGVPLGNSSGFFLSVILSVDNDNTQLSKITNGTGGPSSGADCLALNKQIGIDVGQAIANANTTIFTAPANLPNEAKYQAALESLGFHLQAILNVANDPSISTVNPGKYLAVIQKLNRDINAIQAVITANDPTNLAGCITATNNLAGDLQSILASLTDV